MDDMTSKGIMALIKVTLMFFLIYPQDFMKNASVILYQTFLIVFNVVMTKIVITQKEAIQPTKSVLNPR